MRLILFLCLFVLQVFALDVSSKITAVYKEVQISYEIKSINEALKNQEKFEKVKHFVRLFRHKSNDGLWLKIPLVNSSHKSLDRVFLSRWDNVDFELFAVKNEKIIFQESISNNKYIKNSSYFKLPFRESIDFYVHVKSKESLDQFFYVYFLDEDSVENFIISNEKFYHHGLFFGILLTMAMYSFFMYLSIREKGYLFLGFYQTSVLIATSDLRQYFFILLENMPNLADFLLRGVFGYIIMFLSILFTKEFLNTKEEMPRFNLFLNIIMIFLLPINAIDSNINYSSFLYIIYVFTGIYVFFHKKNLLAFFYTLGFLGFPIYLFLLNFGILFDWDFYFEYHYAKQIFTCIESFALTMALYLKIHSIVKEKEKAKEDAIKNEKLVLEQSRFASMGEMLASIAHQWRQPLNHLNLLIANLQLAFDAGKLDKNYLEKKAKEADNQLKYMSSTVENFSSFFSTKGEKNEFHLLDVCEYTIGLVESRLKKHNISILLNSNDDCFHINYKNELIQVLAIVLNNAIDALVINSIKSKEIKITVNPNQILIEDNAGGISKEILAKIFDPYFSTKDKKFGTGLGLYTSKIIVNNLIKGKIEAWNIDKGVCFSITIP